LILISHKDGIKKSLKSTFRKIPMDEMDIRAFITKKGRLGKGAISSPAISIFANSLELAY
jgi:hypothetical protein